MEVLQAALARDRVREAIYVLEAYDWQRWLTLEAWLQLKPGSALWVEWAEDFTVVDDEGGVRTIQVKRRRDAITINDKTIREVVVRALERQPEVVTIIWTSAEIGKEKRSPLPEPVIRYWQEAVQKSRPIAPLQEYLGQADWLPGRVRERLLAAGASEFRDLLRKVQWITGDGGVQAVRSRVEKLISQRLAGLCVPAAPSLTDLAVSVLFGQITRISSLPDVRDRRLTHSGLDDELLAYNQSINGALAEKVKPKPRLLAAHRVRGRLSGGQPLAPFSSGWFSYTYQAITMIGREPELQALDDFVALDRDFAWWTLGGPAGIGKSRLAFEFLQGLPSTWTPAFIGAGSLRGLEEELDVAGDLFLVVDYAGSHADDVGRFLLLASRSAREDRKLRVLLLERDVEPHADWWLRLLPPLSARASELEGSIFRPALCLGSLEGRESEIVTAWLAAAGLDLKRILPRRNDGYWFNLRKKVGSRPLLLGFAAAALSVGQRRFNSVEDLLSRTMAREHVRWLDRAGTIEALDPILAVGATAATTSGLPVMWPGDGNPVWVRGPGFQMLYIVDSAGAKRPPTTEDLLRLPQTADAAKEEMAKQQKAALSILEPVLGEKSRPSIFQEVWNVFNGWAVSPDLLAEYLLGHYWGPELSHSGKLRLPVADDAMLQAQITAALQFNPLGFLNALDRLREHSWSAAASVRALIACSDLVSQDSRYPVITKDLISQKIYNSTILVGGRPPTVGELRRLGTALRALAATEPQHLGIQYRLWKALGVSMNSLPSDERQAIAAEQVLSAPSLLGYRSSFEAQRFPFENNAVVAALAALPVFEKQHEPASLEPVVELALRLAEADPQIQGYEGNSQRLLLDLSGSKALGNSDSFDTVPGAAGMLQRIKCLALSWLPVSTFESERQVSDAAWALSNLILHFRHLKMVDDAEGLYPALVGVARESCHGADVAEALMVGTANLLRVRLDCGEVPKAAALIPVAAELAQDGPPVLQRGLLEMWQHLLNNSIEREDYDSALDYVSQAAAWHWDTSDREIRTNLALFLQSCVGRSESGAIEHRVAELYWQLSKTHPIASPSIVFANPGLFIERAGNQEGALIQLIFVTMEYLGMYPDDHLAQRVAWGILVYILIYGSEGLQAVQKLMPFTLRLDKGKTSVILPDRTGSAHFSIFQFELPENDNLARYLAAAKERK